MRQFISDMTCIIVAEYMPQVLYSGHKKRLQRSSMLPALLPYLCWPSQWDAVFALHTFIKTDHRAQRESSIVLYPDRVALDLSGYIHIVHGTCTIGTCSHVFEFEE